MGTATVLSTPIVLMQDPSMAGGTGVAFWADIAVIVLAVFAVVAVVVAIPLLVQLRKLFRAATELSRELQLRTGPVVDRTRSIAENVEYVTRSIRGDVDRLHETVAGVAERLDQAVDGVEGRIKEFNALLAVVQGEAEELFIDTASAVRGAKAGARSLGSSGRDPGSLAPPRAGAGSGGGPSSSPDRGGDSPDRGGDSSNPPDDERDPPPASEGEG